MKTYNIAMIGHGFMGKAHSSAVSVLPKYFWPASSTGCLAVLVGRDRARAAEAAERFGFAESATDWKQVVQRPDVDIVDIVAPNRDHKEIALAAIRAGKHVLCEKPLAETAADAHEMMEAARRAGVVNMTAYNYRHTPAVVFARQLITEGKLGRIRHGRFIFTQEWGTDAQLPYSWKFENGGALADVGTHALDAARYLVGEVSSVAAVAATHVPERPLPDGGTAAVEVDDICMALLRFEGGAVGTLEATRTTFGDHNRYGFEITGELGGIRFDYERMNELWYYDASLPRDRRGYRLIRIGERGHPYSSALWPIPGLNIGLLETIVIELHEFLAAVDAGKQVRPDFYDGWRTCAITEAIDCAARSGTWVAVAASGA